LLEGFLTMHRLVALALATSVLPGCFIFFDEHGKGGDQCLLPPGDDVPEPRPGAEPAPQRNPHNLMCESFGGGPGTCDPNCGPCPLGEGETDPKESPNGLAPLPSWGFCNGSCEALDEATCETEATCRVIRDARCAVSGLCETDFVGCVATDQFIDSSMSCNQITDGETCSRNPSCTAFHRENACGGLPFRDSPIPPPCMAEFAFCADENSDPGRCQEQAICDIPTPPCPSGTTAGVADGCFTGVCIPDDLCELAPNQ
jgi:hypothetical protein